MNRALALLAAAVLLAAPAPARAAADSLVLQPAAASTGPDGSVEIRVLVRIHPDGKAVVPARAADVAVSVRGGGTVAPASEDPGETKWVYRAPAAVAVALEATIEARVRAYPDASGSCRIQVKPGTPAAPAAGGDDEEGDLVEGAEAVPAGAVGNLVTVVKWRARETQSDDWNERRLPDRGEEFYAPGLEQDFRLRVNRADVAEIQVQWWRNDRPGRVRTFNERNKRLSVDRDQDGLPDVRFRKVMEKEKGEYTFSIVMKLKDGTTLRENLVVHRARPPKDENEGRKGGGGRK